jgi:hypothetical protein
LRASGAGDRVPACPLLSSLQRTRATWISPPRAARVESAGACRSVAIESAPVRRRRMLHARQARRTHPTDDHRRATRRRSQTRRSRATCPKAEWETRFGDARRFPRVTPAGRAV